jgi:hypothetical protein
VVAAAVAAAAVVIVVVTAAAVVVVVVVVAITGPSPSNVIALYQRLISGHSVPDPNEEKNRLSFGFVFSWSLQAIIGTAS